MTSLPGTLASSLPRLDTIFNAKGALRRSTVARTRRWPPSRRIMSYVGRNLDTPPPAAGARRPVEGMSASDRRARTQRRDRDRDQDAAEQTARHHYLRHLERHPPAVAGNLGAGGAFSGTTHETGCPERNTHERPLRPRVASYVLATPTLRCRLRTLSR